jgi:hypothetical protein
MAYDIDFQDVKRLASIETVAEWLMLPMKGGRCQCPVNEGDKRELVLFPKTQSFCCYGCDKKTGDAIELIAHVLEISQLQAAIKMQNRFKINGHASVKPKGLPPGGLDYLEYDHAMVQALGLSEARAAQLGVGFAGRGTLRGHLCIPVRDKAGNLMGYIGYSPDGVLRIPKSML